MSAVDRARAGSDQSRGSTSQVIVRIPRLPAVAITLELTRPAGRAEEAGLEVGVSLDPRRAPAISRSRGIRRGSSCGRRSRRLRRGSGASSLRGPASPGRSRRRSPGRPFRAARGGSGRVFAGAVVEGEGDDCGRAGRWCRARRCRRCSRPRAPAAGGRRGCRWPAGSAQRPGAARSRRCSSGAPAVALRSEPGVARGRSARTSFSGSGRFTVAAHERLLRSASRRR